MWQSRTPPSPTPIPGCLWVSPGLSCLWWGPALSWCYWQGPDELLRALGDSCTLPSGPIPVSLQLPLSSSFPCSGVLYSCQPEHDLLSPSPTPQNALPPGFCAHVFCTWKAFLPLPQGQTCPIFQIWVPMPPPSCLRSSSAGSHLSLLQISFRQQLVSV